METTTPDHHDNQSPPTSEHLLDDIEYHYVQASANVRFVNWFVDRLILWGLWQLGVTHFAYPIGMFVYSVAGGDKIMIYLVSYLLACIFHVIWYTIFEAATGGKTIGKLITRTRAVTANGARMELRTALIRSLCRLIPFEAFSAFGKPSYPWHDRLSKTLVVDETRTQLPPWN